MIIFATAFADEGEVRPVPAPAELSAPAELPAPPEAHAAKKHKLGGYGLPTVGGNTTDGFGAGVGGELFSRPIDQEFGYRWKLTLSIWATTRGYVSFFSQFERRTAASHDLLRFGVQSWRNLPYSGVGGDMVSVRHGRDAEIGNRIAGPYAMLAHSHLLRPSLRAYAQLWLHPVWVKPFPGGLLDTLDPYAARGGAYGDVTVGLELDTTDRWPMPTAGVRAEVDVRGGGTLAEAAFEPLVGVHTELVTWNELERHLVVGTRVIAEKSFGARPPPEQFVTGGRWRDEIGFEQALAGYGRIRPRGDGLVAGMVEVRPYFFTVGKKWTLDVHASVFAEMGWLLAKNDPGPPMPTIGGGPLLLWQKGSQLRPFVAYGWWSEEVGGARRPVAQVGLSVTDPL